MASTSASRMPRPTRRSSAALRVSPTSCARQSGDVMGNALDDNRASRDAVLASVRKALGRTAPSERARADALAYIAAHRQGPRPAMPADLVARFVERATDMASTVARIASLDDV